MCMSESERECYIMQSVIIVFITLQNQSAPSQMTTSCAIIARKLWCKGTLIYCMSMVMHKWIGLVRVMLAYRYDDCRNER
jgi:hypothetical protein